jgi:hypothetical protein
VAARTREQRARNGYIGAMRQWSRTPDPVAHTAPARAAAEAKLTERFEREVDPEGKYDPATRARMAEYRRKEYFARLALASAKVRRAKRDRRRGGGADA